MPAAIARRRLANQMITGPKPDRVDEVVRRLGAVQAQDYLASLWAIGLRLENATESAVERAVAEGRIVRTWPMRGTLHFVAAPDVRWMLDHFAVRTFASRASWYRQLELDRAVFAKSRKVISRALERDKRLTRPGAYQVLDGAGIATRASRGLEIIGRLAHEGLICHGPREGKQPTFVLLDEWVPAGKPKPRDEALGEIAVRYFSGHGPASVADFAWWSGLSAEASREAVELAKGQLVQEVIGGRTYWSTESARARSNGDSAAHLLPAFDEYTVAYRDRSAVLDPDRARSLNAGGGMLNPTIVLNGRVAGTWKRTLTKEQVRIALAPFEPLSGSERRRLAPVAGRYARFLCREATGV